METIVFDTSVDSSYIGLAVGVLASFIAYAVIARGLFMVTDPFRHSLLSIAEGLAADPNFPDEEIELMEYALSKVFSAGHAWRLVLDVFVWTVRLVFRRAARPKRPDYDPSYAKPFTAFQLRWAVSVFGNSLGATLVFGLILMVLAAFAMSATAIARLLMHGGNGHDGTAVAH